MFQALGHQQLSNSNSQSLRESMRHEMLNQRKWWNKYGDEMEKLHSHPINKSIDKTDESKVELFQDSTMIGWGVGKQKEQKLSDEQDTAQFIDFNKYKEKFGKKKVIQYDFYDDTGIKCLSSPTKSLEVNKQKKPGENKLYNNLKKGKNNVLIFD
ncbi:hypothetical protein ABK040_006357 [Willaertia magna]